MEATISTPRLKLTLVTKVEKGSQELGWWHELRSDEQSTWWRSKTIEETERLVERLLQPNMGNEKTYRIIYAVHEVLTSAELQNDQQKALPNTRFIGIINLISLGPNSLKLPEHLSVQPDDQTLVAELAYAFLPGGWGKGYATESVNAVLEACKNTPAFWTPYQKVYVRAIVNEDNPRSQRVMSKVGLAYKGVYEWSGEAIFVGGRWREQDNIRIYGDYLLT